MSLLVQLYDVSDPKNKINKTLNNGVDVSCEVTESFSVAAPQLLLDAGQAAAYINKNYAYIPEFGRYYFVEPPEYEGAFVKLTLEVDVLYTYRFDILNSDIIAKRSSTRYNKYIVDGVYGVTNRGERHISRFPGSFEADNSGNKYVLKIGGA